MDLTLCQRCEKWNLIQSMVGVSEDGHLLLVCGSTCVREDETVLPSVSVSFPPQPSAEAVAYAKWLAEQWFTGECPMAEEGCRVDRLCWHCFENAQVDFEVV